MVFNEMSHAQSAFSEVTDLVPLSVAAMAMRDATAILVAELVWSNHSREARKLDQWEHLIRGELMKYNAFTPENIDRHVAKALSRLFTLNENRGLKRGREWENIPDRIIN